MPPRSLKYRTLKLLEKSPQTDKALANAIGVSTPWIKLFREGETKNPGVDTVQRLYEHLAGRPLFSDVEQQDNGSTHL